MAQVLQHRQAALIAGIQATGTGGHLLADLAVERMPSTIAGHSVGHSAAGRNANTQLTSNPDHSQGADQIGIIGFAVGGISFTTKETKLDLGPIEVQAEEEHRLPIPAIAAGLAIAAGIVLVVIGSRKA